MVCTPPLVADLSDTRQNWKAQTSQPRKGVSSNKMSKELDRISSNLIKSLAFNLIGLLNFFFYKRGTQIKPCFLYFFLSRDPVNTTDPKSNSLWFRKQSRFCSALKLTEFIHPQCSQNTNHHKKASKEKKGN